MVDSAVSGIYNDRMIVDLEIYPEQLTLTELAARIEAALRGALPDCVWIVAEIASVSHAASGHCYLELVEKRAGEVAAKMRANIWARTWRPLRAQFERATGVSLKAGMQVLIFARVDYKGQFGLSLNVQDIDPSYSLGEMARRKRETLARLETEGLLDRNRSHVLPLVPQRIALISSAAAAGYGDFCHQLEANPRGYRFAHRLFSALVQGAGAEASLCAALRRVSALSGCFDVAVIVRGGGSSVDLDCFDGYELAAAIARCPMPVITGIGHLRDDSVADAAAYLHRKTPTDVADFLIGLASDFEEALLCGAGALIREAQGLLRERLSVLAQLAFRFDRDASGRLVAARRGLEAVGGRLARSTQAASGSCGAELVRCRAEIERVTAAKIATGDMELRLRAQACRAYAPRSVERAQDRLQAVEAAVTHLDPVQVLRRGYSITRQRGRVLKSAAAALPGETLDTTLTDGSIQSVLLSTETRDGTSSGRIDGNVGKG